MSALFAWMTAAVLSQSGPCWTSEDTSPGWKRVELPDKGSALVAPGDVDQFRSGEPVLLRESNPRTYVSGTATKLGRMVFTFQFPPNTRRLELAFIESLRGAQVDVTAYVGLRALRLMDEKRISGRELSLEWGTEDVTSVVVEVHHHLRSRPVVSSWWTTRAAWPEQDSALDASFKSPRSLYFFHPGGGRVLHLCHRPGVSLRMSRWPKEEDRPATAGLKPAP
ncbi:hypothetical protein NVS55_09160 [Myxococcus stipitatus]|uniref:hypothetical protein n=1 Tax=Myxococcus stipitatus TaxID=83455 RepID=UPI00314559E8